MSMIIDATHRIMYVLSVLPMLMGLGACIQGALGLYITHRTGDGPRCNKARKYLFWGAITAYNCRGIGYAHDCSLVLEGCSEGLISPSFSH